MSGLWAVVSEGLGRPVPARTAVAASPVWSRCRVRVIPCRVRQHPGSVSRAAGCSRLADRGVRVLPGGGTALRDGDQGLVNGIESGQQDPGVAPLQDRAGQLPGLIDAVDTGAYPSVDVAQLSPKEVDRGDRLVWGGLPLSGSRHRHSVVRQCGQTADFRPDLTDDVADPGHVPGDRGEPGCRGLHGDLPRHVIGDRGSLLSERAAGSDRLDLRPNGIDQHIDSFRFVGRLKPWHERRAMASCRGQE